MKYTFIFLLTSFLVGQSEDATLTIYKNGTALIKQPVGWEIPSGNSYVTWSSLPNGIHRDTPFLNLEGVTIISQRFNDNIFPFSKPTKMGDRSTFFIFPTRSAQGILTFSNSDLNE